MVRVFCTADLVTLRFCGAVLVVVLTAELLSLVVVLVVVRVPDLSIPLDDEDTAEERLEDLRSALVYSADFLVAVADALETAGEYAALEVL